MAAPLLEKRRAVYDQHRVKPARGEEGLIAIARCSAKEKKARKGVRADDQPEGAFATVH